MERPQHIIQEEDGHYTQRIPRLATQLFISGAHANQKIKEEDDQRHASVAVNEEPNAVEEEDDIDFGDAEDMEVPGDGKLGVKKQTRSVRFSEHIQIIAIDKDDDEYEIPEEKRLDKEVKLTQEKTKHEAFAKKVRFHDVDEKTPEEEHPAKKVRFVL